MTSTWLVLRLSQICSSPASQLLAFDPAFCDPFITFRLLKNWSLLLFDCAGNIFHPSMAKDLMKLTDSPSNLTHLDMSGVGLGIGAAELAAHLLCHPVCMSNVQCWT